MPSKVSAHRARKHTKFQADLAPADAAKLQRLKEELEVRSNADFLAEAVALIGWAVTERRRGRTIVSETTSGERRILVSPRLERVAPDETIPHIEINWTESELEDVARLAASPPAAPTPGLIALMKQHPSRPDK